MTDKHPSIERDVKKLKLSTTMDSKKKEEIVMSLAKHAKQTSKKKTINRSWIYLATASIILLCGLFIYNIIIGEPSNHANQPDTEDNQMNLPADDDETVTDKEKSKGEHEDSDQQELTEVPEKDETPAPNGSNEELIITKGETREGTIIVEGMEEPETFTSFTINPYGITFELAEYLANYEVIGEQVKFYTDPEYASITISVKENANLESVLPNIQEQYHNNEPVQGMNDLPLDENEYYGVFQSFYDPPEGFYLYQIEDNIFIIQYQYGIEGGDGMVPRLEALRKSIQ